MYLTVAVVGGRICKQLLVVWDSYSASCFCPVLGLVFHTEPAVSGFSPSHKPTVSVWSFTQNLL